MCECVSVRVQARDQPIISILHSLLLLYKVCCTHLQMPLLKIKRFISGLAELTVLCAVVNYATLSVQQPLATCKCTCTCFRRYVF